MRRKRNIGLRSKPDNVISGLGSNCECGAENVLWRRMGVCGKCGNTDTHWKLREEIARAIRPSNMFQPGDTVRGPRLDVNGNPIRQRLPHANATWCAYRNRHCTRPLCMENMDCEEVL